MNIYVIRARDLNMRGKPEVRIAIRANDESEARGVWETKFESGFRFISVYHNESPLKNRA